MDSTNNLNFTFDVVLAKDEFQIIDSEYYISYLTLKNFKFCNNNKDVCYPFKQ